jgi:hypothetical protein
VIHGQDEEPVEDDGLWQLVDYWDSGAGMISHDSSGTRPNVAYRKEITVRKFICVAVAMTMLLAAPAAMAERDDGPEPAPGWLMAVDFIFVRPPSWIGAIASTGIFLASLPITYPIGVSSHLGTYMVTVPWRFMSGRYFGNFVDYRDHRTIRGVMKPDEA